MKKVRCQCGEAMGVGYVCDVVDFPKNMVEYWHMPAWIALSHHAARNWGDHTQNGSIKLMISEGCRYGLEAE